MRFCDQNVVYLQNMKSLFGLQVFCVVCCDLRFKLTHLGGKEGRVCVTCHSTLINRECPGGFRYLRAYLLLLHINYGVIMMSFYQGLFARTKRRFGLQIISFPSLRVEVPTALPFTGVCLPHRALSSLRRYNGRSFCSFYFILFIPFNFFLGFFSKHSYNDPISIFILFLFFI